MKALECEMCGMHDMVKVDGLYVCSFCGAKYTPDEAKKLIIDISGSVVNVANQAQLGNLINLAKSALDSKNFAEAEKQANLALAIDSSDFEIYLIKARAIFFQSNPENMRLLESVNTYLSAYRVLSEEERKTKGLILRDEVFEMLKIDVFASIELVKTQRPSAQTVSWVKKSLRSALELLKPLCEATETSYEETKNDLINSCIRKIDAVSISTWESVVAYNYYRESLRDYGKHWKKINRDFTDEFRPSKEIFNSFGDEIYYLTGLMAFAIENKNDKTSFETLASLAKNLSFYLEKKAESVAYERFTKQGILGDVCCYFEVVLSYDKNSVKTLRELQSQYAGMHTQFLELAKSQKVEEKQREREKSFLNEKERFSDYFESHPEKKASYQKEINSLLNSIHDVENKIDLLIHSKELDELSHKITDLENKKNDLSFLKLGERKRLQDKIDLAKNERVNLQKRNEEERQKCEEELESLKSTLKTIKVQLSITF